MVLRLYLAESVSSSTRRDTPASSVVRVGPQEVAHGAFVGHLLESVQGPDVVQSVDAGRETSVETEDLTVHQGGEGKVIKQVGEIFPHIGVAILSQAFVIEPIDLHQKY